MSGKKTLEKKQNEIEVEKSMKLITPAERKEVHKKVTEEKQKEEKPQTIRESSTASSSKKNKGKDVEMK